MNINDKSNYNTFLYTEKTAIKFSRLNDEKFNTGIIGKIRQFLGNAFISLNSTLKWQTHVHAEHMSHGALSENYQENVIAKTVEILEEMNEPPKELIKACNYAKNIAKVQRHVDSILNVTIIGGAASNLIKANVIKNDIKNLKNGESLAIPSSCERHIMLLFITRQENGKFKVVQHNQGIGIERFHFSKVDASGKNLYQTALEIEDVEEKDLCGVGALFIDRVLINSIPLMGTVDNLYSNLLPLLKGTIQNPPSEDPRLWSHGQLGSSCSAACGISLIRSQLDENSFKEFREIGRTEMLLKSYKQIKSGWGNNSTQKAVTLEVVKKLEHSLKKRGQELPQEIQEMQRQLENKPQSAEKQPMTSYNLNDNINFAFTLLKEGNFDDASLEAARPYIEKALKVSVNPASHQELKKLFALTNQLKNYSQDRPFTVNQIYMMTIMSTALKNNIISTSKEINLSRKEKANVSNFCYEMHNRYNGLSLSKRFQKNGTYDLYLSHYQKHFFSSKDELIIPPGLKKLIKTIP